ncbi:AAA family ATPase [Oecophyllibacter saccharovorans]|uniref:Chromosome partition protein Smc n=1 Tax=Oecophyllibacter saccharovorans TaxID=2558360 RepID=A0A506UQP9_9PROT|nr:hypothetical protein [Oecophyllibacter saccharovorans]TPW35691.1 hypothetical protein E3202_01675 [Oecophyllibacter saccharovorans]
MTDPKSHKAAITSLTLSGFKSFADETSLPILPGLSGIVGPNGCGKSNIVEALRWVMGESSARALRGGESDDLIFAGSRGRAARNLMRVALTLQDAQGLAPPPLTDSPVLEVQRQAEREQGISYRLNGRAVRVRDIHTLFADLASGARSSAIISQNRVGRLISARPEERRLLLEEAAGITGLHARRNDAAIKLRQTETNLERARERSQQMEQRLEELQHQVEQARNYRRHAATVRDCEEALLHLQHRQARSQVEKFSSLLEKTRQDLEQLQQSAHQQQKLSTQLQAELARHRQQHGQLDQRWQALHLQVELTRTELRHARQTAADRQEEQAHLETEQERCRTDLTHLLEAQTKDHHQLKILQERLETCTTALPQLQQAHFTAVQALKQARDAQTHAQVTSQTASSQRQRLVQQAEQFQKQLALLRAEKTQRLEERSQLGQKLAVRPAPDQLRAQLGQAQEEHSQQQKQLGNLREAEQETQFSARLTRQEFQQAEAALQRLDHQEKTLAGRLSTQAGRLHDIQKEITSHERALQALPAAQMLEENVQKAESFLSLAQNEVKEAELSCSVQEQEWLTVQGKEAQSRQRRESLEAEETHLTQRLLSEEATVARKREELAVLTGKLPPDAELHQAQNTLEQAEKALEKQLKQHNEMLAEHQALQERTETARIELRETETALLRLQSEKTGLQVSFQQSAAEDAPQQPFPTLATALVCPPELVEAVGNALGASVEGSLAPTDTASFWRRLPPLSLPPVREDLPVLASLVSAPPEAQRRLETIYVVASAEEAERLQPDLQPGQLLVTREGTIWRWDGFVQRAPTASSATRQLALQQQLRAVDQAQAQARRKLQKLQPEVQALEEQCKQAHEALTASTSHLERCQHASAEAGTRLQAVRQARTLQGQALTQGHQHLEQLEKQLTYSRARLQQVMQALAALTVSAPGAEKLQKTLTEARHSLQQCRQQAEAALSAYQKACNQREESKRQKNQCSERLTELRRQLSLTETEKRACQTELATVTAEREACARHKEQRQEKLQLIEKELSSLQNQQKAQAHQQSQQAALCASLDTQLASLLEETHALHQGLQALQQQEQQAANLLTRHETELQMVQLELSQLPPEADTYQLLQKASETCQAQERATQTLQEEIQQTQQEIHHVQSQSETLEGRIEARKAEKTRLETTRDHLTTRFDHLRAQAERSDLKELTRALGEKTRELASLEEERAAQTAQLEEAQASLEAHEAATVVARKQLTEKRETALGLQARLEQALETHDRLQEERPLPSSPAPQLSCALEGLSEREIRKLLKEALNAREGLGSVNLCAEEECTTLQGQYDQLAAEQADLQGAVSRLDTAVQTLNREGRARLKQVFAEMDSQFQSLFSRMFGGGRAHLGLVGSEDPLEAGLEIFAQPPGKKLATLSLLSGGEQALTALSLIFAAFQCTPAPLCVLDEVDAPLDDANVERFCTLLRDMTRQTGTRFLVVTHHQLTMAHMDRLFGVTMQERGVSRLLSVNFDESLALLDNTSQSA